MNTIPKLTHRRPRPAFVHCAVRLRCIIHHHKLPEYK